MALRKTLAKIYSQIRAPSTAPAISATQRRYVLPESGEEEEGLLRRILQCRPIFQAAVPPDRWLPTGDRLIERIRGLNRQRILLDGLAPPPAPAMVEDAEAEEARERISLEEVRKVLRASQMEAARSKLREIPRSSIPYLEFLKICCEESGAGQGTSIARALDESGSVIVLGNVVFLRPEQIVQTIQSAIPSAKDSRKEEELKELEQKKADIDSKASAQVRRELWFGLGLFVAQTAGFMRLTFWELSWDVMEPICFFVASIYFMAGYAFFLRTSREPSFEGFFESRFAAKQRRLMRACGFDLHRFNELRGVCGHRRSSALLELEDLCAAGGGASRCDCRKRNSLIGASH